MRHRSPALLTFLALISLLLLSAGCKKPVQTVPDDQPDEAVEVTRVDTPTRDRDDSMDRTEVTETFNREDPSVRDIDGEPDEMELAGRLRTVFFAFDSFELSETTRSTLVENAEWIKAHSDWNVAVEGHCDERGTIEYNLALGERRAKSVRDYMASLGLDRSRVRIVTYGEERPVYNGHDEAAWSQNRRAEFVLER